MQDVLSELLTALFIGLVYTIDKLIKRYKNKKKGLNNPLEETIQIDVKVYPILWRVLMDFNAIRVVVIQFHNGERYYSGQSIQKYSISHEVYRTGILDIKQNVTNRPLTESMHKLILNLRTKGHHYDDLENTDDYTRVEFKAYNIKSSYALPLLDSNSNIIGFIALHYNYSYKFDDVSMKKLLDFKSRLQTVILNKE